MNIGIRAHDFGKQKVETLADKIEEKGFGCIQLALAKVLDNIQMKDGVLSPGLATYIREVLYQHKVRTAILGCYANMSHPDDIERKKIHNKYREHIRFARDFGCTVVGTETGSLNGDYSYNENNGGEEAFERFIDSLKILVQEAEKFGVIIGIEAVKKHIINTPQRMKRALDTIDSNNVQVIFDPVNLLDITNYEEQDKIINDAFELFGDRIVTIHAKDFIIEDGSLEVVAPGKGLLNYKLLLKHIKDRKPYIDILMEDIKVEDMASSKKYIEELYQTI